MLECDLRCTVDQCGFVETLMMIDIHMFVSVDSVISGVLCEKSVIEEFSVASLAVLRDTRLFDGKECQGASDCGHVISLIFQNARH